MTISNYRTETVMFNAPVLRGVYVDLNRPSPLDNGQWYSVEETNSGLDFDFPAGTLVGKHYLTADFLLDSANGVRFVLALSEANTGREFQFGFSLLSNCSARMRIPLEAVNQNRWAYEREGAWLKPYTMGDRVNLSAVTQMRLLVLRKDKHPVVWCMTPLTATEETPPLLETLVLPGGVLLDSLGQNALREWDGKSRSAEEVTTRLHQQVNSVAEAQFPPSYDRWGGWKDQRFPATGFFHTHHDGQRWWLVTPEGSAFWSSGLDCVEPTIDTTYTGLESALAWLPKADEDYAAAFDAYPGRPQASFSYLTANLIRAFGAAQWYESWQKAAFAFMRQTGFNTVGNWSHWQAARAAGIPYVRPLYFEPSHPIFRDFPDVYAPGFEQEAAVYAQELLETRDDPAMIGYFLMNEPEWGFATETIAAGMLFNTEQCFSRLEFARWLRTKYGEAAALSTAWGVGVTFEQIEAGVWQGTVHTGMNADLEAFSTVLAERYFSVLTAACKIVDPNHLNLGARYYTVPPEWAIEGMRAFDVFSLNCYDERVRDSLGEISTRLNRPILVGEWHFGALDAGLPASGIGRVRDQTARGKAIRVYLEDAAAKPWCVGVHYFTLYDQSALGRFDGENYNIGLIDTCHRPYPAIAEAVRQTHERLYQVASGALAPCDDVPDYLPRLFY
ncbi:MAG: hypothetical protein SF029_09035 [bacterium]|nr:hypothetical protein [bacterium]